MYVACLFADQEIELSPKCTQYLEIDLLAYGHPSNLRLYNKRSLVREEGDMWRPNSIVT
jgi:hypothetical protein